MQDIAVLLALLSRGSSSPLSPIQQLFELLPVDTDTLVALCPVCLRALLLLVTFLPSTCLRLRGEPFVHFAELDYVFDKFADDQILADSVIPHRSLGPLLLTV